MKRRSIPILMYHQVTPRPHPGFRKYAVTPALFAAQLRWLALSGYVSITPDDLLAARTGRAQLPRRPVLITFDDGFQDCVDYAVPLLLAHGFRAVFYLVAGLMGQASAWLMAERGLELPLMDWPAARRLETAGFMCGAHSFSHPRLANLDPAACRQELELSRRCLEDELGHAVTHLAYPYGAYNAAVRSIAADCGYQTACSVQIGLSAPDDDLLALHRVPILGHESLLDFAVRLRTAHSAREAWLGARAALGRRTRGWLARPFDER
jgi:peptidoglycan/xylan/chitin deacetylase (PgdA/CDA1 family)